jgi:hypothetical protein
MHIKIALVLVISALGSFAQTAAPSVARKLTIQTYDGGSAVTELSYGIAVNKGSSLHRRWYVINDSTCPVELGTVGIKPVYRSGGGGSYQFSPLGDLKPTASTSAVEVIFVQFDLWGNRERGLSANEIHDLPLGQSFKIEGSWYASENEVSQQLTSVAYVRNAMTVDGKIWRADLEKISALLQTVALTVSASGLESEAVKPAGK